MSLTPKLDRRAFLRGTAGVALALPVLEAMGIDAQHSLRASVGWTSTMDDVDRFVDAFAVVVDRLRALR